jgi:hypothetical protein
MSKRERERAREILESALILREPLFRCVKIIGRKERERERERERKPKGFNEKRKRRKRKD